MKSIADRNGEGLNFPLLTVKRTTMTNGNWACFDCRLTVRRPTLRMVAFWRPWVVGSKGNEHVKCPQCKEACRFLGPKITVPPKRDKAAWEKLRTQIMKSKRYWSDRSREQKTKRKHEIEKRLQELGRKPKSSGRDHLIKILQNELAELT